MRGFLSVISLVLLSGACQLFDRPAINQENRKQLTHLTISAQAAQRVRFYDVAKNSISADQFNRFLADGDHVSKESVHSDGSEEVSLVSIAEHSNALEGRRVPNFRIGDIQGNIYARDSMDVKVKAMVLTFWRTTSFVCIQELEAMDKLVQEYGKKRDLIWLAAALDPSEDLSRFLRGRDLHFTFVAEQEKLAKRLGLLTYPTHLVVNARGIIERAIVRQPQSSVLIREALDALL